MSQVLFKAERFCDVRAEVKDSQKAQWTWLPCRVINK